MALPARGRAELALSPASWPATQVDRPLRGAFAAVGRWRAARSVELAVGRRAATDGADGLGEAAAARCGNPVAQIHRRLELSRDRQAFGNRAQCGRGPPAPRPQAIAR